MTDKTSRPERAVTKKRRRPYRKPTMSSTEAFEKMALLTCGGNSEAEGECDEL